METTEVLLVSGDTRSGLSVARSLGRQGIPFVVVADKSKCTTASSRYVKHFLVGPSPEEEPEAYVQFLLDVVARYGIKLVIPITDAAMQICAKHREAFPPETRLAAPPSPAVREVMDKRKNLRTANRLRIPCPDQFEMDGIEQVPEMIEHLGFPLVLKNPGPAAEGTRASFDFRWLVAGNEPQLRSYLEQHCSSGEFPLFQKLVTGTLRNLCCFAASGEIVAVHDYRSVRRLDREAVLREVVPTDPALVNYAERMLKELRWDGVAHLAFFVRESDGDARYMETNGRFWASVEGSLRAGWDFPHWTYRYFTDGSLPEPPPIEIGSRTCWHAGDLRLLVSRMRGLDVTGNSTRSRGGALIDYLSGFRPSIHAEAFRLSDPMPEFADHWLTLRDWRARRRSGEQG